jgi:hypothetical protein
MKNLFIYVFIVIIVIFFYSKYIYTETEGFSSTANQQSSTRCPNLLIQKGSRFYLYNSRVAQVPGVNPIEFENLEDYTEFLDWQHSQNIRCPVLYLQETYDAQGETIYKTRPSVTEPQGGLPPSIAFTGPITPENTPILKNNQQAYPNPTLLVDATRDDPPYNKNSYPAYDESSYYVGTTTPLDMMNIKQQQQSVSANPMDANWGGSNYTQTLVDKGYYKENEVNIYVP